MTSTDRAFIAAFHREAKPASTPSTPGAASSFPTRGLPGAGVEVVSFAIAQRPLTLESPATSEQNKPSSDSLEAAPSVSPHKLTLHGPHRRVRPIATLRRPLSACAQQSVEPEEFRPAVVVPRLRWPTVCTQLAAESPDRLALVLDALGHLPGSGTKIIGMAGVSLGAGCTTVALAVARQAARLGRRVAVLEADAVAPCLQAQLGLSALQGFAELLSGQATLPQVTTYAHDDRVAVIAWGSSPAVAIDGRQRLQLSLSASRLRFAFDLVLLDLGAPSLVNRLALDILTAMHGDGVLLIASQLCPPSRLAEIQRQLESTGRPLLGVIENGISSGESD